MFTRIVVFFALVFPALALAAESPVGDAEAGKALYATCIACHGANGEGNPALNSPGIAGQSQSYVMRQLWDFKQGNRGAKPGQSSNEDTRIRSLQSMCASRSPRASARLLHGDG